MRPIRSTINTNGLTIAASLVAITESIAPVQSASWSGGSPARAVVEAAPRGRRARARGPATAHEGQPRDHRVEAARSSATSAGREVAGAWTLQRDAPAIPRRASILVHRIRGIRVVDRVDGMISQISDAMPNSIDYDEHTQRLLIATGYVENVPASGVVLRPS